MWWVLPSNLASLDFPFIPHLSHILSCCACSVFWNSHCLPDTVFALIDSLCSSRKPSSAEQNTRVCSQLESFLSFLPSLLRHNSKCGDRDFGAPTMLQSYYVLLVTGITVVIQIAENSHSCGSWWGMGETGNKISKRNVYCVRWGQESRGLWRRGCHFLKVLEETLNEKTTFDWRYEWAVTWSRGELIEGLPGGPVVRNPSPGAGDAGSILAGELRSHMPWSNWICLPQLKRSLHLPQGSAHIPQQRSCTL